MTLTTAVWISLVAAAGTTAVRALRTRPAPVRVPGALRATADEDWHPHVSSGCGR
jgi:hypothetical protein